MHIDSVFVCYRREDSVAHAGRIYDRLAARFGKNRVFMDIDTIRPGEDFIEVIERRVSGCDAVVTIIGKTWLTSQDDDGKRRLDDPDDYVRREIAAALSRKILIIPALVGGARMPRAVDLPDEIRPLARRNALEIIDTAFESSAAKLIESLDAGIQEARAHKATAPSDTPHAGPDREPGPSETGDSILTSEEPDSPLPRPARLTAPRLVGIAGVVLLLFVSFVVSYLGRSSARQDPASRVPSESTQKVPSPATEAGGSARSPQGADKGQTSRPSRPTSTKPTPAPEEGKRREKVVPRPAPPAASKERQTATDKTVPPLRSAPSVPPPPATPVRVGGNIEPPEKLRHVAPVYPQAAQSAGVSGIVIIEATIDPRGKVSNARVLRGISLLNDAALDAVRQWEYRPTLLNGVPVPVIMTVTVNFTLGD